MLQGLYKQSQQKFCQINANRSTIKVKTINERVYHHFVAQGIHWSLHKKQTCKTLLDIFIY